MSSDSEDQNEIARNKNYKLYKQIFDSIKKEKPGQLNYKELKIALSSMGEHVSENQAKAIVEEIDEDGNLEIDLEEFVTLIRKRIEDPEIKEYSYKAFELFSETKDGHLTLKEMEGIIKFYKKKVTKNELNEMMSILPWQEDGTLNYEQFLDVFLSEL